MCAAGFAGNAVQNHGFVCRETTKSWNETLYFLEDSDATFWHRRWGKSGSKMAFVSRPGDAVFPFWGLVSWGPRGFLVWFLYSICMETTKNVIQIFVFVHFGAMCAAGFAGNAVQNHGFVCVCRETTKSWNETLHFLKDSDATFWHRRCMGEKWLENGLREPARPLFWRVFFQGPRGLPCPQLPQACQNQHYRTKTL